jgi:hypothetical protein
LHGREGWLASSAAQNDRIAPSPLPRSAGSLDREAAARDAAVRHHAGEVEQQRARYDVEVPGLSKEALDTLKAVQMARLTAEIPREGDRYDAQPSSAGRSWYLPHGANAGRSARCKRAGWVHGRSQPAAW